MTKTTCERMSVDDRSGEEYRMAAAKKRAAEVGGVHLGSGEAWEHRRSAKDCLSNHHCSPERALRATLKPRQEKLRA